MNLKQPMRLIVERIETVYDGPTGHVTERLECGHIARRCLSHCKRRRCEQCDPVPRERIGPIVPAIDAAFEPIRAMEALRDEERRDAAWRGRDRRPLYERVLRQRGVWRE